MRAFSEKVEHENYIEFVIDKNEHLNLNEYLPVNGEIMVDGQIFNVCIRLNFNEAEYEDF